jgi:hypothetical protein
MHVARWFLRTGSFHWGWSGALAYETADLTSQMSQSRKLLSGLDAIPLNSLIKVEFHPQ